MRWLMAVALMWALGGEAQAHGGDRHGFSEDEVAWMNRQHSVGPDVVKCCDEHDVYLGVNAIWRPQAGAPHRYEVFIRELQRWVEVPPDRMLQMVQEDPSPWGGEAIVFYSIYPSGVQIWCFNYERTLY